jgi:hypothetical protein
MELRIRRRQGELAEMSQAVRIAGADRKGFTDALKRLMDEAQ